MWLLHKLFIVLCDWLLLGPGAHRPPRGLTARSILRLRLGSWPVVDFDLSCNPLPLSILGLGLHIAKSLLFIQVHVLTPRHDLLCLVYDLGVALFLFLCNLIETGLRQTASDLWYLGHKVCPLRLLLHSHAHVLKWPLSAAFSLWLVLGFRDALGLLVDVHARCRVVVVWTHIPCDIFVQEKTIPGGFVQS